jgi:nucleotide-binding universal stress UspA family protein
MTTDRSISVADPWADASPGEFRELFRPGRSFPLLLAIESDDNAPAAIRVAEALVAKGALPRVITATELLPASGSPEAMLILAETALGDDFHSGRRSRLQTVIARTVGRPPNWPIKSVVGDAAQSILREAEGTPTRLIVMGVHRHGKLGQVMGENTASRVMSKAAIPVLGVLPTLSGIPKKIMVATDFGRASREAAHIAANLADPGGVVVLVNASIPSAIVEEGDEGAVLVAREGIEHAFIHLADEISEGKSIRIETVARTGDAATELIAAAEAISPDVIAMASQRHRLVTRLLLGSVTRTITRNGRWPVLITPPRGAASPSRNGMV